MPTPVFAPSRAVTIGGATPQGWKPCLGINSGNNLSFAAKSTYDQNWWWIDATFLLQEEGDTLSAVTGQIVGPDQNLVEIATFITSDFLKAGFHFSGGSSGAIYTLVPLLTTSNGYNWSRNIQMPILTDPFFAGGDTGGTGLVPINYRGPWQANTAYATNDLFTWNGSTYIVTSAFVSGATIDLTHTIVFATGGNVTKEQLEDIFSELPTTLPAQSEQLWLNSGIPVMS